MKGLKTAVLLMGPVLLLIGVGFLLGRKPGTKFLSDPETGPFRVEIASLQLEPITPREAELGFDTKVVAVFRRAGVPKAPKGYKFIVDSIGSFPNQLLLSDGSTVLPDQTKQKLPFKITEEMSFGEPARNTKFIYLMALRDVAPQTQVQLQAGFQCGQMYYKYRAGKVVGVQEPMAQASAKLPVKKAGQIIKLADVSRRCPLEVVKAELIPATPAPLHGNDLHLDIYVRNPEQRSRTSGHSDLPYAVQPDGKIVRKLADAGGGMSTVPGQFFAEKAKEANVYHARFFLSSKFLPKQKGSYLETKVSIDDCWPLRVRVPVFKEG